MELLIILGTVVLVFLVAGWLFRLVRNTLQTFLLIGFILLALYLVFGIGPATLWEHLQNWLRSRPGA